jgi:predicted Zn-dependent peptidase
LTTGQSSRLYDSIVNRQQLAISVGTNLGPSIDPDLFVVSAQPRKGVKSEAVEAAIDAEIDKLAKEGPTAQELEKAKNQAIAGYYRELRSINGRAQAIGTYEVLFGDYHRLNNVEEQYQKVTAADIQRVMQKYLVRTNRTVAILVPTEATAATPAGSGESK